MSSPNQNNSDQNLERMLFEGLSEHGFIFQEKCAEVLQHNGERTKWIVHTTEYPVSIKDRDTRVDIVLRDTSTNKYQIYAVVECKRVNPERRYWLFGNPLLPSFSQPLLINLRSEEFSPSGRHVGKHLHYAQLKLHYDDIATYLIDNWWLEIGKKGNKAYASPNPVEDAFVQACIGVSGIAHEQEIQWQKNRGAFSALFIPVVITTAPLYVAMYDLKDVDLASGSIERDKVLFGPRGQKAEKMEWVLVDYGASRRISPELLYEHAPILGISPVDIEELHKRSIFVVNSEYIVKFFARLHLV
jgi:hypothetical protein